MIEFMIEFMKGLAVGGALALIFFGCMTLIGLMIKVLISFWKDE